VNSKLVTAVLVLLLTAPAAAQSLRWEYWYNGKDDSADLGLCLVQDGGGNLCAAGSSWRSGTDHDLAVVGLTSGGSQRWVYTYNGTGNAVDRANALLYGTDGNIYASGWSNDSATGDDFVAISLDASGSERWVYRYNGPSDSSDGGNSLDCDSAGNLYAGLASHGGQTGFDFAVVSFDTAGGHRWDYRYNGTANSTDRANGLVFGGDGNVYVAGQSTGDTTYWDFTVISLDTAGAERWVYIYDCSGAIDYARSIDYGEDGNIYVAGWSEGIDTGHDFTVISLTSAGEERCNIYAAGVSEDSLELRGFLVVSLTPDGGQERWVYGYSGPFHGNSDATALVEGDSGFIYAAGAGESSGTALDFVVVKLDTAGSPLWAIRYDGPGHSDDWACSIVYGTDGDVYVAGQSGGGRTGTDLTVIGIDPRAGTTEDDGLLLRCTPGFPTIARGVLNLGVGSRQYSACRAKLIDAAGRNVLDLHAGANDVSRLSPGVYFVREAQAQAQVQAVWRVVISK